jgi:hypothetical protein
VREFANQKALVDYAERSTYGKACPPSPDVSCSRQINMRLWMYARPVVA